MPSTARADGVDRGAGWHDIAPAKPMPNGVAERLIGRRRDDRLDEHLSPSLAAAHAGLYISETGMWLQPRRSICSSQ